MTRQFIHEMRDTPDLITTYQPRPRYAKRDGAEAAYRTQNHTATTRS